MELAKDTPLFKIKSNNVNNCWEISLLNTHNKICSSILNNRLNNICARIENKIMLEEPSFSHDVFVLRQLMDKRIEFHLKLA